MRTETRGGIKEGQERESRRGRMERWGEKKERGGEEGRKESESEGEERKRKGWRQKKKGRRRRKEWMGERREMVKTFCSKLTHSSFGDEGRKESSLESVLYQ